MNNQTSNGYKNYPLIIFNQDKELKYTWIQNPYPGFSAETLIGKTDKDVFNSGDLILLSRIKKHVLENDMVFRKEIELSFNNKKYYYDLHIETLRDSKGNITGITGILWDISDLKYSKENRDTINEKLSFKMQNDISNPSVRKFTHDLNNSLTAIKGYTELLRSRYKNTTPDIVTATDKILESVNRTGELVKEFKKSGMRENVLPY